MNVKKPTCLKILTDAGIQTGIHYFPNHYLSAHKDLTNCDLPVTEDVFRQLLSLPLHPDLETDDVLLVCRVLRELLNE